MIVHVQVERLARWLKVHQVTHVSSTACTRRVRVVAGERVVWIACGRRLPAHRQCVGCRTRVIIESDQAVLPFAVDI